MLIDNSINSFSSIRIILIKKFAFLFFYFLNLQRETRAFILQGTARTRFSIWNIERISIWRKTTGSIKRSQFADSASSLDFKQWQVIIKKLKTFLFAPHRLLVREPVIEILDVQLWNGLSAKKKVLCQRAWVYWWVPLEVKAKVPFSQSSLKLFQRDNSFIITPKSERFSTRLRQRSTVHEPLMKLKPSHKQEVTGSVQN